MNAPLLADFDTPNKPAGCGRRPGRALVAIVMAFVLPSAAWAYDLHFDYTSFETNFQQPHFDVLNYPSINGNYMNTSTDNHRQEMVNNGNELAEFYNWLTDRYSEQTVKNGAAAADVIHQYTMNNSYNTNFNPPRPNWIVLNEISSSLWSANPGDPSISTYRTWLIDVVTRLHDFYGYNVVTLAPFQNPGQNNASWQALQAKSYIGIECYLSGTEVWNSGTTNAARLAWAQSQYQASKNSYIARGVPANRLFVTEHFANNDVTFINSQGQEQTVGWGRAGLASAADWDTVIQIRQDAILAVGFDGFLAYNWGGNGLGVTQAEQIQHEYYYRTRRVLASQKPQWLPDTAINVNGTTIPLSWSQPLNWLGGVPNAAGAEINFWRTIKANRTITLDGDKTAGKLTFDSPFSYTINPGTGGNLIINNSASAASLTVSQGSHTINTNVQLTSNLTAAINTGTFTISGALSGAGGLTKNGAGTLSFTGTNSYAGNTTVQGGKLSFSNRGLADGADVAVSSGATLELKFSGSADVIDSLLLNGISQPVGIWGAPGSGAQFTSSLLLGTGWLQVQTYVPSFLAGDYNSNGIVDTGDYIVWRRSVGAASIPNRATQNTGPVGQADYDTWRGRLGMMVSSAGSGSSGQMAAAIPEPSTLGMLIVFLSIAFYSRRNAKRLLLLRFRCELFN